MSLFNHFQMPNTLEELGDQEVAESQLSARPSHTSPREREPLDARISAASYFSELEPNDNLQSAAIQRELIEAERQGRARQLIVDEIDAASTREDDSIDVSIPERVTYLQYVGSYVQVPRPILRLRNEGGGDPRASQPVVRLGLDGPSRGYRILDPYIDPNQPLLDPPLSTLQEERHRLTRVTAHRNAYQRHREQQQSSQASNAQQQRRRQRRPRFQITAQIAQECARSRSFNPEGMDHTDLRLLERIYQEGSRALLEGLAQEEITRHRVIEMALAGAVDDHLAVLRGIEDDGDDMDTFPIGHRRRWIHSNSILSPAEADTGNRSRMRRFDHGVETGVRETCIRLSGDLRYWTAWVRSGTYVEGVCFDTATGLFDVVNSDESNRLMRSRSNWQATEEDRLYRIQSMAHISCLRVPM